jgi:Mg2+ and Co2+ transporter CorA
MDINLIPENWADFPEEFRARIGKRAGRQRLMRFEGQLLLLLHRAPNAHEEKREAHLFWKRADNTWVSNVFESSTEAVLAHIEDYGQRLEKLEQQEESAKTSADYFQILEVLSPTARAAGHLHEVLQEARDAHPRDRDLIVWRDQAYVTHRSAELLYTETKNALDFMVAKQTEKLAQASHSMSVSSHRLNILAAFFFPITVITALVGMSYREVLADAFPIWGFWLTIFLSLVLGVLITLLINRPSSSD